MDPTELQRLFILQQQGEKLQKQQKYRQALDKYQQILQYNKNYFGTQSEQYFRISMKMCQLSNLISMIFLQKDKSDLCYVFLQKADAHTCNDPKLMAVTLNNKACFYRKTGKHRTALQCLQQALSLQWKGQEKNTLADTYLNLCAVLSHLNRHAEALENALLSVTLLQDEIFCGQNNKVSSQRCYVLAIAYHNLAVELQYLQRFQESISFYQKAHRFSEKNLGQENGLTVKLAGVLQNAKIVKGTKKFDRERVKMMSKQKKYVDKTDKILKMRSVYNERPNTAGKKSNFGGKY